MVGSAGRRVRRPTQRRLGKQGVSRVGTKRAMTSKGKRNRQGVGGKRKLRRSY